MDLSLRYEILDTIASGDFAVVLRARDRELGREVAIKQIHQQFLSDPQQLARYWQEAQLLASLQHPSILTIYDIVRPRGWLILELMRGNLLQATHGEPINLDSLRVALIGCLDALQFLHTNGVIHGDVKPTNMLISPRNRIVLGDFGLARRASSEEGSLLKGTTKYMAPEMVSNQFGAIGPASDLYSLGFSAYELMCGAQFESLFPGLGTFGRDRQIAWMMWHAAPDRHLPEVGRVLEGVPADLAHVIEKLVAKDQSQRYRSAAEALRDLHSGSPAPAAYSPEEEEADRMADRVAAARRKRVLRLAAVLAGSFFLIVCMQLLLSKSSGPKKPPAEETTQGVITNVFPDERKVEMQPSEGGGLIDVLLKPDDEFFVNDKKLSARYLQPNDRITIKFVRDDQGRTVRKQIYATRPEADQGRMPR